MPIPTPEPGLVICYAYLWDQEAQEGQQEGRKNRPCVIVLVTERSPGDELVVTVLPVTHRPPQPNNAGLEIPSTVKRLLGLDNESSWVIVSEGDRFVWPGYDLRKIPGSDRYDFGFLPPRYFMQILNAFQEWRIKQRAQITPRD